MGWISSRSGWLLELLTELTKIKIEKMNKQKNNFDNNDNDQGWRDISNFTRDLQQPFQLYRESEQTYLQVVVKR